ncbi:MAG: stage III sporulation protein AE [Clostridia bacterium]|nr:stage III sporulation protein AE [Clostridia bacterium]
MEEQKNTFEIKQFIENADEYVDGEFLKESDLNDLLNSAIKGQVDNKKVLSKFYGLFGKEFKNTLATLSSILVIIVIHSILKSISESLENDNISRLIFYVQYILIVTIVMSNFSQIITMIKTSTTNMVGFINILIPLLTTLMVFTGNLTTTSMLQPVIMFSVNFIGNMIHSVILPVVLVASSLSIVSKISDRVQIDRLSKMFKSGITWFLGIALTIFVAVVSLEGTLSSSVDGITAKTTKAVVSSAIPIVGKILGDAVDSVLGCGIILKNAVGIVGVVVILGICIGPILKLVLAMLTYKILARRMPANCRRKDFEII